MKTIKIDQLLKTLNLRVRLAGDTIFERHEDFEDCVQAGYFGESIQIWFPCKVSGKDHQAEAAYPFFVIKAASESMEDSALVPSFDKGEYACGVAALIALLRNYLRSRPFSLIKYTHGHYQVLDPEGFDYVGQYLNLREAKRVCKGYWILD